MRFAMLQSLFSAIATLLGALCGWWLREQYARNRSRIVRHEKQLACATLTTLDQLIGDVRSDVAEHASRIATLSRRLHLDGPDKPHLVAACASEIAEHNQWIGFRLQLAQAKLEAQSAQIEWWLRGAETGAARRKPNAQERTPAAPLDQLKGLASQLADDTGAYGSRMHDIGQEICTNHGEGAQVMGAITDIMQATVGMQQRIATAEQKIKEQAKQLEMQAVIARTDSLTELANRRAFDEELTRRAAEFHRHGHPVSVLMIDVDHFKHLNDAQGHQAGDTVLRGLAIILRSVMRETDVVARYGGEEFAVILPGTNIDEAKTVARRVCQSLSKALFAFADLKLHVTVSAGVAQILDSEQEQETVQRADEALYAAKQSGRNQAFWHDGKTSHPVVADRSRSLQPVYDTSAAEPAKRAVTSEPPIGPAPGRGMQSSGSLSPNRLRESGSTGQQEFADVLQRFSNRTIFCANVTRRLEEWRRGGRVFSVILARIDDLPMLRQRYGDGCGQLLALTMARMLEALTRDMDERCSYDDTTFALLVPGADRAAALDIAQRLKEGVSSCRLRYGTSLLEFTASMSVVEAGQGKSAFEVLTRAERALDAATTPSGSVTCC
jgi:diguanylate cyclase